MTVPARSSRQAFTLVEMLVVIGIVAILASLTVPAVHSITRGSHLTQAAQIVENELAAARQVALSQNRVVEVRFYRPTAPLAGETATSPAANKYRGVQSFQYDDQALNPVALDKVHWLPGGVVIDSTPALSSLLASSQAKSWSPSDPQVPLPGVKTAYDACAFAFRPDGSTSLNPPIGQQWFLTLHAGEDGDNRTTLPKNFFMLQIDPLNGNIRSYRP